MSSKKKPNKKENQNNRDITPIESSQILKRLLNIRMPRCTACSTTWFYDSDEKKGPSFLKSNLNAYIEERVKDYIPFPTCICTTTLLTSSNASKLDQILTNILSERNDEVSSSSCSSTSSNNKSANRKRIYKDKRWTDDNILLDILLNQSGISSSDITNFPQKGMCRSCMQQFVACAEEVIVHDYRDENQPNILFSTGKNCPCCRKKFSPKSLDYLLKSNDQHKGSNAKKGSLSSWNESVMNTIKFVRFSKRLKRALINKDLGRGAKVTKACSMVTESTNDGLLEKIESVVDASKSFLSEWIEDEVSSDDCFSCSDNDDDEEDDYFNLSKKKLGLNSVVASNSQLKKRHHAVLNDGELKEELMRKDPKFRQEYEDYMFIKTMMQTKEGRKRLNIDSFDEDDRDHMIKQDEEMAKILHKQETQVHNKVHKSSIMNYFRTHSDTSQRKAEKSTELNKMQRGRSENTKEQPKDESNTYDNGLANYHVSDQLKSDEELAIELSKQLNNPSVNKITAYKAPILRYLKQDKTSKLKEDRRREIANRQSRPTSIIYILDTDEQKKGINQQIDLRPFIQMKEIENRQSRSTSVIHILDTDEQKKGINLHFDLRSPKCDESELLSRDPRILHPLDDSKQKKGTPHHLTLPSLEFKTNTVATLGKFTANREVNNERKESQDVSVQEQMTFDLTDD